MGHWQEAHCSAHGHWFEPCSASTPIDNGSTDGRCPTNGVQMDTVANRITERLRHWFQGFQVETRVFLALWHAWNRSQHAQYWEFTISNQCAIDLYDFRWSNCGWLSQLSRTMRLIHTCWVVCLDYEHFSRATFLSRRTQRKSDVTVTLLNHAKRNMKSSDEWKILYQFVHFSKWNTICF